MLSEETCKEKDTTERTRSKNILVQPARFYRDGIV